jgi:hypothetical protein
VNTGELKDRYRSDVRDTDSSTPLWSDADIYDYMDDAQKMFCRLQGGIADTTTDSICKISYAANDQYKAISPLILKIRQVVRESDQLEVEVLNFEDLQMHALADDYGFQPPYKIDSTPGEVRAIVVGMQEGMIRLVRFPTAADSLRLTVYRMPLVDITTTGNQTFEIAAVHVRPLLYWMKHLGHLKQDAETYDKGRADMFEALFRQYCDQAKAEREKREHKYRTVGYGGL